MPSIDFSAQFGGRDAAESVLPHFNALKAAAHEIHLEGFPFPKLAFILRVDGDVNQYRLSGAGNLEIDEEGEYLSVDIGITFNDRGRIPEVVTKAILSSSDLIKVAQKRHSWAVDFQALQQCLFDLIDGYANELSGGH